MTELEGLEEKFREALASRNKSKLLEVHAKAIGLVSGNEPPPVISASKKAYQQLIHAYICHVASGDCDQKLPKKPRHSVERSRLHLREMKKHSPLTSRLCAKYRVKT